MDQRTRERLPVLPTLVRTAAERRRAAAPAGCGPRSRPTRAPHPRQRRHVATSGHAEGHRPPRLGRRRRHRQAPQPVLRGRGGVLGPRRDRGVAADRHPLRGTARTEPPQHHRVPAARPPASSCRCCRSRHPRPTPNACYLLTELRHAFALVDGPRRIPALSSRLVIEDDEQARDLAGLAVPLTGSLEATGDPWLPYRLIDPAGEPVEAVSDFFRDLQAAGRSTATIRSYGMDLLRWFRFLWAIGVAWDRATRVEARDFCRWMLVAGKPSRPHWRRPRRSAGEPATVVAYAPSVRAHCRDGAALLLRLSPRRGARPDREPVSAGPVAARRPRARAPQSDGAVPATSGRGCIGRGCRRGFRGRSPDEEFNEIFATLPSHRDRALVAFYVSTGARASELLSATQGGVDPGRQLITVVRKGTREQQELPASTDAFVWLRLYQLEMEGLIPKGRRQPLWWTLRTAAAAVDLSRGAPHVRARGRAGRRHRDAARAAAHRRLPDGRGPGAAVDRCPARPRACPADHHADLPHAAQGGGDPPGAGPSRRTDPARRRTGTLRLLRRDTGPRRWRCCSGAGRRDRSDVRTSPSCSGCGVSSVQGAAGVGAHPVSRRVRWPRTGRPPGVSAARRWSSSPAGSFVLDNADSQERRVRGLAWLLDWLADQPGETWQQRWMASGADAAGGALATGADRLAATRVAGDRGGCVPSCRAALVVAICGDLVRPSLSCLVAGAAGKGSLTRNLARTRDPQGFARLRDVVRHRPPRVRAGREPHAARGALRSSPPRAAPWPTSPSATRWN